MLSKPLCCLLHYYRTGDIFFLLSVMDYYFSSQFSHIDYVFLLIHHSSHM